MYWKFMKKRFDVRFQDQPWPEELDLVARRFSETSSNQLGVHLEGSTVVVPSNRIDEALGKGSKAPNDDPGTKAGPSIDLFRLTWAGDQLLKATQVPPAVFNSYNALIAYLAEKSEWGGQQAWFDGVQVRLVANMDSVDSHFLLSRKPEYEHLFVIGLNYVEYYRPVPCGSLR